MNIHDELYLPQAEGLPPSSIKAGFAEADITPEPGMEIPGAYVKAFAHSVHDPCKVRAVVFDDGRCRVALVSVDALMVPRPLAVAARLALQQRCGIAPECVLISATHSHSSGPLGMVLPGQFDHASPLVQKLAYQLSSCAHPGYLKRVEQQLVHAVTRANENRTQVWLSFGRDREEKVAFNRRFKMKNGLTFTHPGRGHPDIVAPAGPMDPEVGVLGVWDQNRNLLGCLVNYACHATTSPEGFSANWIYYLEKTVRGTLGAHAVVLFLQGASGDVTQVDNLSPYLEPPAEQSARRVGGCVGASALKALLLAEPGGHCSLNALATTLKLRRRAPAPDRLKQALELVQRPEREVGHTQWAFAKETVLLDALLAKGNEVEAEIQAIQVGPAVFLSLPGELFVEWGLALKRQSPFPFTWPVELANGCVGYIPTEEAFGPSGGGYETRLTSYTNLEPGAGRQLVDIALDLANQMTPQPVPEPRKAAPATAAWSYGSTASW